MIAIIALAAALQPSFNSPDPIRIKTPDGGVFIVQPIDDRPLPKCIEYVMPDGSIDCYVWQRPAEGKEDRK